MKKTSFSNHTTITCGWYTLDGFTCLEMMPCWTMGYATYFVNVSYCAEFHHSLVCRMEHSGKGPFANGLAFIILILSDNILPRSLQWRERAQIKVEEHVMCEDAAVQQDLIHCTDLGGISLMCEEWHLATKQADWLTRRR